MGEPLHDIDKIFWEGIEEHSEYPSKKSGIRSKPVSTDTAVTVKYYSLNRAAVILLIHLLGVVTSTC